MKVTIDLPDQLVKKVKLRAVHDGQKLKNTVENLLLKGLKMPEPVRKKSRRGGLGIDSETGLPVFRAAPDAVIKKMTVKQTLEMVRRIDEEDDLESARIFARH